MTNVITDSVDANVSIEERNYDLLKSTINLSIGASENQSKVTVFVEEGKDIPKINETISIEINGSTVYTGLIKQVKYLETNQKMQLTCYNIVREMKNITYTSSYARNSSDNPTGVETIGFSGETPYEKSVKEHIKDIVKDAFENIDFSVDDIIFTFEKDTLSINVDNTTFRDEEVYPNRSTLENNPAYGAVSENSTFTLNVEEKSVKKIFDKLANISGSIWYVDENNNIVFGKTKPLEENKNGKPYEIKHIKKRESGEYIPPYRGVKVIGADTSRKAEETALHDIACVYKPIVEERGEKPYYVYKDKDIKNQRQAEIVAQNMFNTIKSNKNYGKIQAVVDTEKIKPGMVIEYPTLSGYPFVVNSVKHNINTGDGFFSTLTIESPVNEEEEKWWEIDYESGEEIKNDEQEERGTTRDF